VALFNGIRKQFGLNTYLLRISLPKGEEAPAPVPVPTILPKLPPEELDQDDNRTMTRTSSTSGSVDQMTTQGINTLKLGPRDVQEIGFFLREFVVQGLVPWMERAVTEWNETVR
jgi:trafficking protein particle complex subunit 8